MCVHTLNLAQSSAPAQLALYDDATQETLACHRVISQQGGLATFFLGGRLLQLRRVPVPGDRRPRTGEYHEWPEDDEEAGRLATYAAVHSLHMDDRHVFLPYLRGAIHGFSRASRMRLLCKINRLSAPELPRCPKFITLTYPRELLPSWQWGKRQLDVFLTYLFRRWGRSAALWRMEFQEDGALHFHIMLFYQPFLPWRWVAAAWDKLIGNQVTPEQSASTQIKAMNGWRQGAYYVAKYIAKDTEEAYWDMEHGRHWGVRNWAMLPVHQVVVALSAVEFFAMRRWVKLFRQARGVRTRDLGKALPFCHQAVAGITMFLGAPDVLRMLRCLHGRALAMPRSLK